MRQSKLQAGLDRDEALARNCGESASHLSRHWQAADMDGTLGVVLDAYQAQVVVDTGIVGPHIARHDPARVLRTVAAMRTVLDEHREKNGYCDTCREYDYGYECEHHWNAVPYPCPTVQALEAIYAGDPEPRYYTVLVNWSEEDGEHVGICPAFPSLSYVAPGYFDALQGIHQLVQDTIADMNSRGEELPEEV